jgi:alkane 1-monooxygenase
MESAKNWGARILLFLPFVLPLIFFRKVPIIRFDHPRWVLAAILYAYALPPILDLIGGNNRVNNHPLRQSWTSTAFEYVSLPRILFIKVLILKILMLKIVSTGRFDLIDCLGIAYLTGQTISSYGIFIAHELLHRRSKIDKICAEIMMVTVMYPHFCIEHLYGHHKHAATAEDPATARFGESVYAFLPRAIFGGAIHAWQLEVRRLARRGHRWFDYRNQMLRYLAEVCLLFVAVSYFFGLLGFLALVTQGFVAVITLEVINYVQHYGLERKAIAPGLYENTDVGHSWNSECWFSNGYWLNLGRHSDHHCAPSRSFQMLRNFSDEPELPAGFPAMFLLAFVPPLWFRVMNPRVKMLHQTSRRVGVEVAERETSVPPSEPGPGFLNGGGLVMGSSVGLLLAVDIFYGYPYGLITLSVVCVSLLGARYIVARSVPGQVHPQH